LRHPAGKGGGGRGLIRVVDLFAFSHGGDRKACQFAHKKTRMRLSLFT